MATTTKQNYNNPTLKTSSAISKIDSLLRIIWGRLTKTFDNSSSNSNVNKFDMNKEKQRQIRDLSRKSVEVHYVMTRIL